MPRSSSARLALLASLVLFCPASVGFAQDEPDISSAVQPDNQDPPPVLVSLEEGEEEESVAEYLDEGDFAPAVNWTIQFDGIFLRRSSRESQPLVNGDTPFSVSDLDLPFRLGGRLTAIRHGVLGSRWDAEVTYFGIDGGWSDQAISANATTFFTTPNIFFGARTVTTQYSSSLHSTEVNLRRRLGNSFTLISGFRWIEVRDSLFTDLVGSSHEIDVNNHLYGYQLGGDLWFLTVGRLDLGGWLKAGIYGNAADQTTTLVNVGGAAPPFGARGGHAAFAGEIGLTGTYRFNDWLGARFGYQALWLDSMVLAGPQIPSSDIATGVATLDFSDTLFYHGAFVGVEATW